MTIFLRLSWTFLALWNLMTYDDSVLIKTADIGQVIMVRDEGDPAPDVVEYRHGLTPPMRDARRRRFRREPDLNEKKIANIGVDQAVEEKKIKKMDTNEENTSLEFEEEQKWVSALVTYGIKLRTDNKPYKAEMKQFPAKIVGMMKDDILYASRGGPIILYQMLVVVDDADTENENLIMAASCATPD